MNRLTTVLYPSLPGLPGPPSDSSSSGPHADGGPARADSPALAAAPDPHFHDAMNAMSIYDDPRSTIFPSPGARGVVSSATYASVANSAITLSSAVASSSASSVSSSGPSLLRRLTDEGIKASAARRSVSPSPSRKRADRRLRVNLMQVQNKPKSQRSAPSPTIGGRLNSMAKGPGGRFVVGGGQYLRVMEITNPSEDGTHTPSSPKSPGRLAGPPFARGPGGTSISEVVNFWKASWSTAKGVNDVDWGVQNFDSKIVTATPSGNFMIFDVNRGKLEREPSGGSPRPMNCIRFSKCPASAYLLITGGTEGQVRLWDMRVADPTSRKFYKHNAPVSALALSPDDPHSFVVGTEAGGLLRYDYRIPNKSVGKIWGAHGSKPVMDLKWKPPVDEFGPAMLGKGWLASAGGDRTVQIWDMSQTWDKAASPTHTLHTAHPLRYVDWRPNHPTELVTVPFDIFAVPSGPTASSGDLAKPEPVPDESDLTSLEVWDVRRHYVSKYALSGLEGNAVAAIWEDADTLVACYQNGALVQRDLNSKTSKIYPLECLPRQVSAWNSKGELAYALDKFRPGEIPFDDIKPEFSSWHFGSNRHRKAVSDAAYVPRQTLGVVSLPDNDESEFAYMANHYRLEGDLPEKLCRWNREVAQVCDRPDEARIWDHLQGLIEEFGVTTAEGFFNEAVFTQAGKVTAAPAHPTSPHALEEQDTRSPPTPPRAGGIPLERAESIVWEEKAGDSGFESDSSDNSSSDESSPRPQTPRKSRFKAFTSPVLTAPSALRPALAGRTDAGQTRRKDKRLTVLDTPLSEDMPTPIADLDYPDPYGIAAALESIAQPGGPVRRAPGGGSHSTPHSTCPPTPVLGAGRGSGHVSPVMLNSARPSIVAATVDRIQPAVITRRAQQSFPQEQWDRYRELRCQTFLDWWESYIDDGEVQIATTLFVVGSSVVKFPERKVERVFSSYIDLLERHNLNIPMAYLRRYSDLLDLQTLPSQEGITHILHCTTCGKSTGSLEDMPGGKKKFWWCTRCRRGAAVCVVCREPVRGLWLGCNKCRHGGHHSCMRLYYLETEETVAMAASDPAGASRAHSSGGTGGLLPPPPTTPTGMSGFPGGSGTQAATAGGASVGPGIAPNGTPAPPPPPPPPPPPSSSAFGASLESGMTERTERDSGDAPATAGCEVLVATNTCPSGCGCQCRLFRGGA